MNQPAGTIHYELKDLATVADRLIALKDRVAVYTFTGPLGAGKTTLIQEMLQRWGVQSAITSPTFSIVNIYANQQGDHFYHFDLYRLQSLEEFIASGFQEYLYAKKSWALIEWPESIRSLLHSRVCHITIDYESQDARLLHYTVD